MSKIWEITIKEAFEDAGIIATPEQIDTVISWVEGTHENYGLATGNDFIPDPRESEIKQLKLAHKKEIESLESQIFNYRKSVATRRGVDINQVYMDDDGSVMISPR